MTKLVGINDLLVLPAEPGNKNDKTRAINWTDKPAIRGTHETSTKTEARAEDREYYIDILKNQQIEINMDKTAQSDTQILITSNLLGQGDMKLGQMLMKKFIYSLTQIEGAVKSLIFINSGVLLTTEGSDLIEHLYILEERGIEVLSCSSCLDYYHLSDKLRVGGVTNMYNITLKLLEGRKIITL